MPPADSRSRRDAVTARSSRRALTFLGALILALMLVSGVASSPAAARLAPAPGDGPGAPADVSVDEVPEIDGIPDIIVDVDGEDEGLSQAVTIILLLTIGSVAPGLLLLMTCFTRFVIVMGLTKQALGLQTLPPNQVMVGLALFLTFFVMQPVLGEINEAALQPLLAGEISQGTALTAAFEPLREFMLAQTRDTDLQLFIDMSGAEQPGDVADVPAATLIPAFVLSELRTAFVIGFVVFVPFLVIDLVTAAVLMSMGMVMLPPVFISLPLKLLLFVLVDGWTLLIGQVVASVNGVGV